MIKRIISLALLIATCFCIFSCSDLEVYEETIFEESVSNIENSEVDNTEDKGTYFVEPPIAHPLTAYNLKDAVMLLTEPRYYVELILNSDPGAFFVEKASPAYDMMVADIKESVGGVPMVSCYENHEDLPITFWIEDRYDDHGVRSVCTCKDLYYLSIHVLKDEYADSKTIEEYCLKRFGERWMSKKEEIEISRGSTTVPALLYYPAKGQKRISWLENGFMMVVTTQETVDIEPIAENVKYTIISIENIK